MAEERVQKILARTGYGSRRANEELILAGRVRVNGVVAVLGTKADPQSDTITVDNQAIPKEPASVYVALNKPQNVLSEVNVEVGDSRETVRDLVPVPGHLFIVGRLDYESEGLILMTNDGDLANRLTHPRYGHEKEYRVLLSQRPDERQYDAWRHGIVLEDGYRTAPAQVRLESASGHNVWLRVILNEGRKRQIREMGRLTGLHVMRIQRIRIGTLLLGDLKAGQWRHLRPDEVRSLQITKTRADRPRIRVARTAAQRAPQQRSGERRNPNAPRAAGQPDTEQRGSDPRRAPRRPSAPRAAGQTDTEQRSSDPRRAPRRPSAPRAAGQPDTEQRNSDPRRAQRRPTSSRGSTASTSQRPDAGSGRRRPDPRRSQRSETDQRKK